MDWRLTLRRQPNLILIVIEGTLFRRQLVLDPWAAPISQKEGYLSIALVANKESIRRNYVLSLGSGWF
jgi:hypothetical protein